MTDRYGPSNAPDELLMKHLLGEASPGEEKEATAWIGDSAEHRAYYEGLRQLWEAARYAAAGTPGEDEAWERFRSRVEDSRPPARVAGWWRVAAAAAILLALTGTVWMFSSRTGTERVFRSGDQVRQLTLPDGSRVTLNAGSTLTYPASFGSKTRHLTLEGEAFFDIAPRKNLPFIATAGSVTVTVLGTRFNVNGRGDDTRVVVESGRVEVSCGRQALQLGPRESAVVSGPEGTLAKRAVRGDLWDYYRTGTFRCDNTPLGVLIATLNEAYHARISVRDSATASLPITTVFSATQPLDTILAVIGETFGLHVSRTADQIEIY